MKFIIGKSGLQSGARDSVRNMIYDICTCTEIYISD